MKELFRKILLIIIASYIESIFYLYLINIYVIFPITFLLYSFFVYKIDKYNNAIEAFSIGLLVDLISGTYFGTNAALFCLMSYLINLNSNSFKLFSYLQVCLFFGITSSAYVGFTQMILNLYNFSYTILFTSALFNILFCILIAMLPIYFPRFFSRKI
mgnify:CR=1 FL=1